MRLRANERLDDALVLGHRAAAVRQVNSERQAYRQTRGSLHRTTWNWPWMLRQISAARESQRRSVARRRRPAARRRAKLR